MLIRFESAPQERLAKVVKASSANRLGCSCASLSIACVCVCAEAATEERYTERVKSSALQTWPCVHWVHWAHRGRTGSHWAPGACLLTLLRQAECSSVSHYSLSGQISKGFV